MTDFEKDFGISQPKIEKDFESDFGIVPEKPVEQKPITYIPSSLELALEEKPQPGEQIAKIKEDENDYPFFETLIDYWKGGGVSSSFKQTVYNIGAVIEGMKSESLKGERGLSFYNQNELGKQLDEEIIKEDEKKKRFIELSQQNSEKISAIINKNYDPNTSWGQAGGQKLQRSLAIAITDAPNVLANVGVYGLFGAGGAAAVFATKGYADSYVDTRIKLEENKDLTDAQKDDIATKRGLIDGVVQGVASSISVGSLKDLAFGREILKNSAKVLGVPLAIDAESRFTNDLFELTKEKKLLTTDKKELSNIISEMVTDTLLPNAIMVTGFDANNVRLQRLNNEWRAQRVQERKIIREAIKNSEIQKTIEENNIQNYEAQLKVNPSDITLQKELENSQKRLEWATQRIEQRRDQDFVAKTIERQGDTSFLNNPFSFLKNQFKYSDDNFRTVLENEMKGTDPYTIAQSIFGRTEGFEELLKIAQPKPGQTRAEMEKELRPRINYLKEFASNRYSGGKILSLLLQGGEVDAPVRPGTIGVELPNIRRVTSESFDQIIKRMEPSEIKHFEEWLNHNRIHYRVPSEIKLETGNADPKNDLTPNGIKLFAEYNRIKNNVADYMQQRGVFSPDEASQFKNYEYYTPLSELKGNSISAVKNRLLRAHTQSARVPELIPEFIRTMQDALNASETNATRRFITAELSKSMDQTNLDRLMRKDKSEYGNYYEQYSRGKLQERTVNNSKVLSAIQMEESVPPDALMRTFSLPATILRATVVNFPGFKISTGLKDVMQTIIQKPTALQYFFHGLGDALVRDYRDNYLDNTKNIFGDKVNANRLEVNRDLDFSGAKFSKGNFEINNLTKNLADNVYNYNSNAYRAKQVLGNINDALGGIPGILKKTYQMNWSEDMMRNARALSYLSEMIKKPTYSKYITNKNDNIYSQLVELKDASPANYTQLLAGAAHEAKRPSDYSRRGTGYAVRFLTSAIPFSNPALASAYNFYDSYRSILNGSARTTEKMDVLGGTALALAAGIAASMYEDSDDTDQKMMNRMKFGETVVTTGFPVGALFLNVGRIIGNLSIKNEEKADRMFAQLPSEIGQALSIIGAPTSPLVSAATKMAGIRSIFPFMPYSPEKPPQYLTDHKASSLAQDMSQIIFETTNGKIDMSPSKFDDVLATLTGTVYRVGKSLYSAKNNTDKKDYYDVMSEVTGLAAFKYNPSTSTKEQQDFYEKKANELMLSNVIQDYKTLAIGSALVGDSSTHKEQLDMINKLLSTDDKQTLGKAFFLNPGIQKLTSQRKGLVNSLSEMLKDSSKTITEKEQLEKLYIEKIKTIDTQLESLHKTLFDSLKKSENKPKDKRGASFMERVMKLIPPYTKSAYASSNEDWSIDNKEYPLTTEQKTQEIKENNDYEAINNLKSFGIKDNDLAKKYIWRLIGNEDWRTESYRDAKDIWTIGLGLNINVHKKLLESVIGKEKMKDVNDNKNFKISDEEVSQLFQLSLKDTNKKILAKVPNFKSLPDEIKLAIFDIVYNTGGNTMSGVLRAAKDENYPKMIDEIIWKDPETKEKQTTYYLNNKSRAQENIDLIKSYIKKEVEKIKKEVLKGENKIPPNNLQKKEKIELPIKIIKI